MIPFDRHRRRDAATVGIPPAHTSSVHLGGHTSAPLEAATVFLAYLCPAGEAPTSSTKTVRLRLNEKDLTLLLTNPSPRRPERAWMSSAAASTTSVSSPEHSRTSRWLAPPTPAATSCELTAAPQPSPLIHTHHHDLAC